jgi:hypothetical protein
VHFGFAGFELSLNNEKSTIELRLLVTASQYRLNSVDTSILHELAEKEDFDWAFFFTLARRHKVFPRVWNNITATIPEVLPEDIKAEQKMLFRRHILHCMATVGQLCSVSDLFNKHNIVHVPYKGPVLASYLFDDFAMRSYVDLDILVATEDFPQVYALLSANGYTPEVDISQRQSAAYASVEDNLMFVPVRGVPIEIHWELSGRYLAKPIGLEYVSRRLSSIAMQGRTFPVFSPEHHLIYLCLHGTKHCWEQLDLVACLADLLLKETEIDWELVFQAADELKCRRMVCIGLLLAGYLYDIHLPDEIQAAVNEDKKALFWGEKIFESIQEAASRQGRAGVAGQDPRFSLFRLQVRDSRLDAARYLLRMVFCPTKAEWKAIRLPSAFTFVYWVARPFRILWLGIAGTIAGKWRNLN